MSSNTSDDLLHSVPPGHQNNNLQQDPATAQGARNAEIVGAFMAGNPNPFKKPPVSPHAESTRPAPGAQYLAPQRSAPTHAPETPAPAPAPAAAEPAQDPRQLAIEQLRAAEQLVADVGARYLRNLENHDISLGKARDIIDTVVVRGAVYTSTYELIRGLNVTFRTRPAGAEATVHALLEHQRIVTQDRYNHELAKLLLAFSVVAIGDHVFEVPTAESPNAKTLDYLSKIPSPLFRLLNARLRKFEEMIEVALSDGYVENF